MEIQAVAKIVAPILTTFVAWILKKYFRDRPKLLTYMVQASAIPLRDQSNTNVNTHSIVVRNAGNRTAHNVRIGHNYLPPSYQLFPPLHHQVVNEKGEIDKPTEILIPTLVPDEQVSISYLYFQPFTWNQIHCYCKSDEMSAKYVNVVPTRKLSAFQIFILWALMFIGVSTVVYWVILGAFEWVK